MADQTEIPDDFEALLEFLKSSRGFDFTGYKRSSLMRRVQKRMHMIGQTEYGDYQDYLEVHPEEFTQLFNTILINVTAFFRDQAAWDFLAQAVLPRLLEEKQDEQFRVWCAGVASGEEAYTTVMLLAEAMGEDVLRARAKVYATDVDEDALNAARQGTYGPKALEPVPQKLADKYFEAANGNLTFRRDLRRMVIFGRHDLVQDAPISRIDLLVCRNTLMYFNAEAQARILGHFHFALNDPGALFLGKSEMLLTHGDLFQPIDLKRRVFVKAPTVEPREALATARAAEAGDPPAHVAEVGRLREASADSSPVAQIVVDLDGELVVANQQARLLLGLSNQDVGRRLQDLEVSYRPVELRSKIEDAYADRRQVAVRGVEWTRAPEDQRSLDVEIVPIHGVTGTLLGVSVTFDDVTAAHVMQDELIQSKRELETAYEELQSTVEELETTNEELHSTVEELETTNEELQSTNEELETMNEELQSTNEELETMNTELEERTHEASSVSAFLESVMSSLSVGMIVVDEHVNVTSWNQLAEDLWGLRASEVVGGNLLSLDIGLPMQPLAPLIRAVLSGESQSEEITLDAINRRGKPITCRVRCTPLGGPGAERRGAILLIDQVDGQD